MYSELINSLQPVSVDQRAFLDRVRSSMEHYFGDDQRRIDHALQVASYAEQMLAFIEADVVLILSAAYLHDIGIHEAERVHGSSAGNWQELEGPPIARQILNGLEADAFLVDRVATLVGCHHTPEGDDSAEFRILWDADALVNFGEILVGKDDESINQIINSHMTTEPGYQMARKLFLSTY